MDFEHMTAPCGLDCFNCQVYLAQDNEKLRAQVSKVMNVPPEQAVCRGCRDQGGIMSQFGLTRPCHVYECISNKSIKICSDCSDFPCDHLHPYADMAMKVPHNMKVFNLSLIKKMGLDAWAKTKAKNVRETYFTGKWKI